MPSFANTVAVVSAACGAALIAAIVAAGLRRWPLAVKVSRAVTLLGPVVLVVSVIGFIAVPAAGRGASDPTRATVLAEGMSQVMNCGALAYVASILGAIIWGVAAWRIRAGGRSAG
jgi:hypothetical protein